MDEGERGRDTEGRQSSSQQARTVQGSSSGAGRHWPSRSIPRRNPMKTISLRQPWASLVVHDYLHAVALDWSRTYCGPLAVHAMRSHAPETEALFENEPWKSSLRALGYNQIGDLPVGVIVGVVQLVNVQPV